MVTTKHVKKLLITFLKIAVSVAIIGYLVYDAVRGKEHGNVFANLWNQPKDWGTLAVAWACCAAAALTTFVRWWYLVRALDVPCRFRDAFRISFWGYLFNLAPLGIVGGDLVKAVMLDHEHPHHRAKAIASVLVDRVIGLYVLFVLATVAIWLTEFWRIENEFIWWTCKVTFFATIGSTVGLAVVLGPDLTGGRLMPLLRRLPKIGRPLESLVSAVRMYRQKPMVLVISCAMTFGVHSLFATGCHLIACGLPGNHLSLADHFVVMPVGAATGVIPLMAGPLEWMLDNLYTRVPVAGPPILEGQGLVVALAYRLICVLIAALGVFYYFGNRREMAEVMHEAEQE